MEEAWVVIFRNLYTGFLLRDFAGKIVPGMLFLFSIAAMFRRPREIANDLKKEMPLFGVLLIAGFAWTVTLGTQSLAEGLGIWNYFPASASAAQAKLSWRQLLVPGAESDFDKATLEVDSFQALANEDEKQQYERFVVIKEATGNLFVAALLSLPAWLIALWTWTSKDTARKHSRLRDLLQAFRLVRVRAILGVAYLLCIFVGLHRMHSQHVNRQLKYAEDIGDRLKVSPNKTPALPKDQH